MIPRHAFNIAPQGETEIVMTRVFDAPPALVWQCLTRPELIARWLLGPDGWTMPVCEVDLRVGGAWRWMWQHPDGSAMTARGVYREIAPPHRLVHTERFEEPWYPGEAVDTYLLAPQPGGTLLTLTMALPSRATREGVLKMGMERGVARSYERMDDLLAAGELSPPSA